MHLEASDLAALDDAQRLAVLETMVIGLVADDKVVPSELRRFEEIVMGLPWGVDREVLAGMVRGARERLANLKTSAEVTDYVVRLAEKLPSPALRDKLVFTMATLMYADGEVVQIEKNVLGLFVVAFGITSDRVAAIRAALNVPTPVPPPSSTTTN
ncbi:MAG: TerB family tellurite resistance protein [Deltaproteobacteria bacterium]|nr:TerB family tellurite resistance protein [Deltaproteobacteria bacterium]MCW5808548.1 TerB family tellurite resistance protein [Deltaproteobacteria bacterium]